jgi:hypothetical protein
MHVTLTVDRDYPEYDFFLVNGGAPVERLPLTASSPIQLLPEGRTGGYREWTVRAVPRSLGAVPSGAEWFTDNSKAGIITFFEREDRWALRIDFGANSLPFYDNRDRIEITYRLEIDGDRGRIIKVSENVADPWVKRSWAAGGMFFIVGVGWLGVWISRRIIRGIRGPTEPNRGELPPPPATLPNPQTNQPQRPAGVEGQQEHG